MTNPWSGQHIICIRQHHLEGGYEKNRDVQQISFYLVNDSYGQVNRKSYMRCWPAIYTNGVISNDTESPIDRFRGNGIDVKYLENGTI